MAIENVTFTELWAWLAAIFGGFLLLTQVVDKIVSIVKKAKAPNDTQNERIGKLEGRMDHVEKCLDSDNKRLDILDSGDRVTQRALLALLDHALDGNNVKQMEEAKQEIIDNLINR